MAIAVAIRNAAGIAWGVDVALVSNADSRLFSGEAVSDVAKNAALRQRVRHFERQQRVVRRPSTFQLNRHAC